MNEELQQAVSKMLEGAIAGVDKATDFLSGEIPLYIQELLMWKAAYSFIEMFFGIVLIALLFYATWKKTKPMWDWLEKEDCEILMLFLSIPWCLVFLPALSMLNITWLQIWIAPRVYLVEYAAALAK